MNTTYSQIIIGSGFAGLCAAIKLKQQGENNFLILERNSQLGGTWYDNHYPGAACDVESHLYSFSFEPNPNWSRQFSPQQEILAYMNATAAKYDIFKHIRFNTEITQATFDESTAIWQLCTFNKQHFFASVIISCTGGLSQPAYPDIKGLHTFKGACFHTAKWDQKFDYKNKTVAVIGTGASAIQVVPAIAAETKQLLLYQRTPPWIMPKPDAQISEWRKWMYHHIPGCQLLHRKRLYWQHEMMAWGFIRQPALLKLGSKLAYRHLKKSVPNVSLRKKLTPEYTMGCKRVLLSNDYYQALGRENVELITEKILEINETGIRTADGKQQNTDAIILATGFQAAEQVSRFEIKGRNGLDLNTAWQNGAEAYLGTTVSGFPNMFLVVGPNTGLGHSSMILMIEAQVQYIMQTLNAMKQKKARFIDLKPEAQRIYNQEIQEKLSRTVWQTGGCVSWYQMKNGKNVTLWPGFTFSFMQRTQKFDPEKYEIVS